MDLMNAMDWKDLRVLDKEVGNWGNPSAIFKDLIFQLDLFCYQEGLNCLITSGTQGVHAAKSLHYKGRAIDCMFPGVALWELPKKVFKSALRYNFSGLGIYNGWRLHHGAKPIGGMHFEMEWDLPPLKKKLWVRTEDGDLGAAEEVFEKYFPSLPPPDWER